MYIMEHMWLLLPKGLRNTLNCVTWTYSSAVSGVSLNINVWPTQVGLMRVCTLVRCGTIVSPFCLRIRLTLLVDKNIDYSDVFLYLHTHRRDSIFSLLFPSRSTSWYSWTQKKACLLNKHCCHTQLPTAYWNKYFTSFFYTVLLSSIVLIKVHRNINDTPLCRSAILRKIFFPQFSSFFLYLHCINRCVFEGVWQ